MGAAYATRQATKVDGECLGDSEGKAQTRFLDSQTVGSELFVLIYVM